MPTRKEWAEAAQESQRILDKMTPEEKERNAETGYLDYLIRKRDWQQMNAENTQDWGED